MMEGCKKEGQVQLNLSSLTTDAKNLETDKASLENYILLKR